MAEDAPDEAVVDAVLSASRSLIAVATMSLGAAAEDTTLAQYRALVVLASRGPQRMTDLAAALDVTPSTAGRMCDRLLRTYYEGPRSATRSATVFNLGYTEVEAERYPWVARLTPNFTGSVSPRRTPAGEQRAA